MMRPRLQGASDAPLQLTDDDRIHNSGWGRPAEQYRTPGIGSGFVIDLHRTLLAWHDAPADLRESLATFAPRRRRYPADLLSQCARALIHALTGESTSAAMDVRATLATLCEVVIRAGLTDGVVLTCAASARDALATPLDHAVSARDAALTLVTAVCTRPPTVMWGIEPSLDYLTVDGVLRLRWLHRTRAGADALTAWESMTRITAAGGVHA
jgi:hypothetical protein